MPSKLPKKEIQKIRKLARTMKLRDVARITGYSHCAVEKYAKGIRQARNKPRVNRPTHPCPSCGSTRVKSNGKLAWKCVSCGRNWRKYPKFLRVSLREHNLMQGLKNQGMSVRRIARKLNRGRRTVQKHIHNQIVPRF